MLAVVLDAVCVQHEFGKLAKGGTRSQAIKRLHNQTVHDGPAEALSSSHERVHHYRGVAVGPREQ